MATHYTSTSETKYHTSKGVYGDYKNVWYQFAITVTISAAGAVSYSITSTNNVNAIKGWSGCQTSAWIEINGTTVLAADQYGSGFPRDNNSTKSGTAGTTTSGSVTVKTKIIPGSDYTGWPTQWDNSLITSTVYRNYWNDIAAPSAPTITDSYENGFSITGYTSSGAHGNSVNGTTLYYKVGGGSTYTAVTRNTLTYSGSFTPDSGTGNTVAVSAYTTVDGVNNDPSSSVTTAYIRRYKPPLAPGKPALAASSYKNGRLTIKQDWTYTWTAASPGTGKGTTIGTNDSTQTTSKVKGYKIQLQKKSPTATSYTTIPIIKADGTKLGGTDNIYYADITSLTFSPLRSGILPGDYVKLLIKPYTQYGSSNTKTPIPSELYRSSDTASDASLVQNAGVMRVKPSAAIGWKEGVVWVKVNKGTAAKPNVQWVEADIVKTKTSSGWKESQ